MAKKRVIAYYMHEQEQGWAAQSLQNAEFTEGFAIGEIEEADIPALESHGLVVAEALAVPPASPRAPEVDEPMAAPGGGGRGAPPAVTPVASDLYYVGLTGPLLPSWRAALEAAGAQIRAALPGQELVARIPPAQVAAVRALPFCSGLRMRESDRNLPTRGEVAAIGSPTAVRAIVAYDILLDEGADLADFLADLAALGVPVAAAEDRKVRVYLLDDDPRLVTISEMTAAVFDIQPWSPPELYNDRARELTGLDGPAGLVPRFTFPLAGDHEVVAVADTGLDSTHPDFAGRVVGIQALGRPGDASDPHGHGTHVAGSVLGDGSASAGQLRGVAPGARLFFQSLLDASGRLGGLPFRLETLFADAYAAGARVHNNSWGAAAAAAYRVNSREVDAFVHQHKDMLIVIAAGNEGSAASPLLGNRNSQPGFVDWLSVGAPATAKNALTVGASRSDRLGGGLASLDYGAVWPQKFPAPPAATERISGDAQAIAAFSSRGPCDDYRIKPDLVAPGTDILSCRSAAAPLQNFWGPDPVNARYAYMGGTSMAAPLVSGMAAIVRQYYRQHRAHEPSAALVKATLINACRPLGAPSALADFPATPNYHQGFGAIYLPLAVPNALEPGFTLEFHDNWAAPATHFQATGQRRRFRFSLNAGAALRLAMAYTDLPGRALQNNLNLFLQLPDGGKRFGNMRLPQGLNQPDTTNNVELIRLDDAPAGDYLIQVVAANLLAPQDFALVLAGALASPLTEV